MGSGLISIAMTGINAAQMALLTTSNNITNASTEGYTRQRTVQASNPTVMTGAGGLGQGTHVVTVERMYSQALTKQVLSAQTSVSALDTYSAQIAQIDNLLADKTAGLTPAIQTFFDGIQAVAASPSSTSARQSMVSAAESMVSTFRSIYSRLDELESGVNAQIGSTITTINSYTEQIASLNQKIISAQALNGQPANDLLDKRDQLVADLNELVQVSTTTNTDGSYNVFVGTGQQLVVGNTSTDMAAVASAADPSRLVVGMVGASGNVQELPETLITGGKLGGLLSFRSEALDTAFNQLGMLAASVAQTFNAQHALGQDMLGNIAGSAAFIADFFTTDDPVVIGNAKNNGTAVVTAGFDAASYNGTNFYTNLTDSDYRLSYDGANFTLKRLSDNTSWIGASLGAVNTLLSADPQGFTLSDNGGSYIAGDSYLIQPTRDLGRNLSVDSSLAADPRLIAAGSPARGSAALTNTGSASVNSVSVGPNYSISGLPLTITHNAGALSWFPAGATVTVTAGAVSTPYTIGAAPANTVPYTSGATYTIDAGSPNAISIQLSGIPGANDSFTISANTGNVGVEDSSNMIRLGRLQTQNTVLGGTATFEDDYAAFVNDIGNKAASADIASTAQGALLGQATAAREAVSGVNLDEEAAKLIEFQQAYQASAKVLQVASTLFDTLLSIGR